MIPVNGAALGRRAADWEGLALTALAKAIKFGFGSIGCMIG